MDTCDLCRLTFFKSTLTYYTDEYGVTMLALCTSCKKGDK